MKYRVFLPILAGIVGLAVGVMTAPNARADNGRFVCDKECPPCKQVCDHTCKDARTGKEFGCGACQCATGTGGCCVGHTEHEPDPFRGR